MTVTDAPTCSAGVSIWCRSRSPGPASSSPARSPGRPRARSAAAATSESPDHRSAPSFAKGWMPWPRTGLLTRGSSLAAHAFPSGPVGRTVAPALGAGPGRGSPLTVARPCRLRRRSLGADRLPSTPGTVSRAGFDSLWLADSPYRVGARARQARQATGRPWRPLVGCLSTTTGQPKTDSSTARAAAPSPGGPTRATRPPPSSSRRSHTSAARSRSCETSSDRHARARR